MIDKRPSLPQRAGVIMGTSSESALDLATASRPGSKMEIQMSPMAMQTAKDWASAWELAEAG